MLNMTMYERLKELRKKRGITQQELAEKVGYKTGSAVNKIELGLRDLNYSKICAFAVALGTTVSYLCDGEKEKKKPKNCYKENVVFETECVKFGSCPSCGKEVQESMNFCMECGQGLDWSE